MMYSVVKIAMPLCERINRVVVEECTVVSKIEIMFVG